MREAPALALITALQDMGARVRAFDPAGMNQARSLLKNVTYCADAYDCANGADALVIATEWEQFRALDLERLRDLMACPVVVDLRNIYRPHDMSRLGFAYACVGRPVKVSGLVENVSLNEPMSPPRERASSEEVA
jgi:UDPglucose 6-dehydrogenase